MASFLLNKAPRVRDAINFVMAVQKELEQTVSSVIITHYFRLNRMEVHFVPSVMLNEDTKLLKQMNADKFVEMGFDPLK